LKSGEKVVVDPESTVQRAMLIFYALTNVGAFFALATTYSEKYVGYWLAFLTPGIMYFLLPFLLWFLHSRLVIYPPDGSALNKAWNITVVAFKYNRFNVFRKDFWDTAKPSSLLERGITIYRGKPISWTDKDADDVKRTLQACMIFVYFPVYNINDNGIGSVQTAQASTMTTNGAPNDILNNFNALTIIVAIPLLSYVVYPALARYKIKFGRISRITFGFTLAWISGIYGAVLQWKIYQTSPGGYYATDYAEAGKGVSPLSIWITIPNVALGALSECFCNVTAYELAYARSPPGMKALVVSIYLFMNALSYALGLILTPAINDPHLIWYVDGEECMRARTTLTAVTGYGPDLQSHCSFRPSFSGSNISTSTTTSL
jgi:dipeptide/tripeptide permease